MTNCAFCNGEVIEAEYASEGFQTMSMMVDSISSIFGFGKKDKPTKCKNGIQLQEGNKLYFDSSAREYSLLGIEIKYCPFCGKELEQKEEDENDDT